MKAATALARTPGRDRQASLISSAASLFAAKGFKGTTTKEIAKAAGVCEARCSCLGKDWRFETS